MNRITIYIGKFQQPCFEWVDVDKESPSNLFYCLQVVEGLRPQSNRTVQFITENGEQIGMHQMPAEVKRT